MRTEYVTGPLTFTSDRADKVAEIQVAESEENPGQVSIGFFDYEEGENLGTIHLTREKSQELIDAIMMWRRQHP